MADIDLCGRQLLFVNENVVVHMYGLKLQKIQECNIIFPIYCTFNLVTATRMTKVPVFLWIVQYPRPLVLYYQLVRGFLRDGVRG